MGADNHHLVVTDIDDNAMTLELTDFPSLSLPLGGARDALSRSDSLSMMLADSTRIPPEAEEAAGGGTITAPMHGQLLSIDVAAGDAVTKGQRIAVLEAMKMQHELIAPGDGAVVDVMAVAGKQIGAGDLIMMLELENETVINRDFRY